MTPKEAWVILATMQQRREKRYMRAAEPCGLEPETPWYMTTLAWESGWLDDLADNDYAGLLEAAEHGRSLHSADILSQEQFTRDADELHHIIFLTPLRADCYGR